MSAKEFVDTNILIYAHDLDAGWKREVAAERIKLLWESGLGVISVQVLQEFYVNVTRKIKQPLPPAVARGLIDTYTAWQVVVPSPQDVLQASEIQERYQLSFWDAMIITAAGNGGAELLLSEDLGAGQIFNGVRVVNPFADQSKP